MLMSKKLLKKFITMSNTLDCNDNNGNNMLHHLCNSGDKQLTKLFLEKTLENGELTDIINEYNGNKETPLHIADKNGYNDIAQTLVNYGANPKIKNKEGKNIDLTKTQKGGGKKIIYGSRKL